MDLKEMRKSLSRFEESAAQIFILVATLALYLLSGNSIFGVLVAIEFVAFVALEIYQGVQSHGVSHEIVDTIKSLGIAVLIWLSFSVILGTAVPVSAIVSCSMLPNLQRGDLTIIKGSGAGTLIAPQIEVSDEQLAIIANPKTLVISPYGNETVMGSMYSNCMAYAYTDPLCRNFLQEPEKFIEKRGEMEFIYKQCNRKEMGTGKAQMTPCIYAISYKGKEYAMNLSNSIIVYEPAKGDLFSYTGDIVHRVQMKIRAGNSTYLLTKGDNNNVFDVQFYDFTHQLANTPVREQKIKGAHIFSIPYVGYFKLFLSGYTEEGQYCDSNLIG